jgi:hypothetical protein
LYHVTLRPPFRVVQSAVIGQKLCLCVRNFTPPRSYKHCGYPGGVTSVPPTAVGPHPVTEVKFERKQALKLYRGAAENLNSTKQSERVPKRWSYTNRPLLSSLLCDWGKKKRSISWQRRKLSLLWKMFAVRHGCSLFNVSHSSILFYLLTGCTVSRCYDVTMLS